MEYAGMIIFIIIIITTIIYNKKKNRKKPAKEKAHAEVSTVANGLQTFDSSGTIDVDITSRLQKILGIISIDSSQRTGHITNPQLAGQDVWYFFLSCSYPEINVTSQPKTLPAITVSGDELSWEFPRDGVDCKLMYGVY